MKTNFDIIPDRETERYGRRSTKVMAGFVAAAFVLMILVIILVVTMPQNDTVKYKGGQYTLLQYPIDIFYYDLAEGVEGYEEDETVLLKGSNWPMVYNSGDVFCHEDDVDDANAYYNNHENYDWYVVIDAEDAEKTYSLEISMEDFEYIYQMKDIDKETAIFFEDIETMGSLIKVSKDGFIEGRTGLAQYEGNWYWRTEIIDESREKDGTWPEYVIPLPDTVNAEINESIGN